MNPFLGPFPPVNMLDGYYVFLVETMQLLCCCWLVVKWFKTFTNPVTSLLRIHSFAQSQSFTMIVVWYTRKRRLVNLRQVPDEQVPPSQTPELQSVLTDALVGCLRKGQVQRIYGEVPEHSSPLWSH